MIAEFKKILNQFGLEYWNRYYSIYKGFVRDNDDPDNLGRIKVDVPQIYGSNKFEYWALPKGQYSGDKTGAFFIPNKGDNIWVQFEGGDIRFPVWEYGWRATDQTPDGATKDVKVLVTTTGQRIELDDDKKEIRIKDSNDNEVHLNSTGVSIVSGKVSLGALNGSAEPALLGDTAKTLIDNLITALSSLVTVGGPTTQTISPATVVQLQAVSAQLSTMLSQKVTLD